MNVDVDTLRDNYLNKINDLYNKEMYFIQECVTFPKKMSLEQSILDFQLRIFLKENNNIIVNCISTPYCDRNRKNKLGILEVDVFGQPDVLIQNNTTKIVDDTWDSLNW